MASKRSGSGFPQVASTISSDLSPLPSSPPCSPTPAILESAPDCTATSGVPLITRPQQPFEPLEERWEQSPVEGNLSEDYTDPRDERAVAQRIMQLITDCRFDFHSWQRADISSDGLVFEDSEIAMLEPSPRLPPLRVDILSNMQFIEYEELMLGLLDRIKKINIRADELCGVAKQNLFSRVEDEIHRLRGLKLHAWKVQANSTSIALPAPQSGPFREIDTDDEMNSIILAIYVMVAATLVISGISESACGFLLKGLSLVTELCLSQTGPLTPQSERLLNCTWLRPRYGSGLPLGSPSPSRRYAHVKSDWGEGWMNGNILLRLSGTHRR